MSGLGEASTILGLISAIVTVVDVAKKTYDTAHGASGLPEAFREVAERLHLIKDTLGTIEKYVKQRNGVLDATTTTAVQKTLESCKDKAKKLEVIFEKCIPGEDTSRFERYVKALRGLSKGDKVELLMKALLEGMQDVVNNFGVTAAEEHMGKLTEAIETLSNMKPSVEDDIIEPGAKTAQNLHSGTGDMYNASGGATQLNAKGNARQYQATTMSFGKDA